MCMMQDENKQLAKLNQVRNELTRFMITYKFAMDEMNTKLNILKQEFQYIHEYNPIEHITSRLKSPESMLRKLQKNDLPISTESIRKNVRDVVGIRVVCSFISDIYTISEMIQQQKDVKLIETKDYIENPKENGYKSLHLILSIPVFMSDREEEVYIELQIRTVAMDFWASLEHKIYYKYNGNIPAHLTKEITETARVANELDLKMEKLHGEVNQIKQKNQEEDLNYLQIDEEKIPLPINFLKTFIDNLS